MRLDLPTFDRPIKAYSGSGLRGQLATSGLDITNDAFMYLSLRVFNFARFVLFSHPKDEAEKAREGGKGGCGVAYPPIGRGKVEAFGRKEDITYRHHRHKHRREQGDEETPRLPPTLFV